MSKMNSATFWVTLLSLCGISGMPSPVVAQPALRNDTATELAVAYEQLVELEVLLAQHATLSEVPFYSQFTDISSSTWQDVGCGIAAVAMLIDYYSDETVVVDQLLSRGIARHAFLTDAGWTHAGLISLAEDYGLTGTSVSLAHLSGTEALRALQQVVSEGPVMASVHYTFEPTNPIPHLVVITNVTDTTVTYNDPAEERGGGTITTQKFLPAWKQRYITIRPTIKSLVETPATSNRPA